MLTIASMVAAVVVPVAVLVGAGVADVTVPGGVVLLAPALGITGSIAAFLYRDIQIAVRVVWALLSVVIGLAVPAAIWALVVVLFGP